MGLAMKYMDGWVTIINKPNYMTLSSASNAINQSHSNDINKAESLAF
jgi:hypothetical protein